MGQLSEITIDAEDPQRLAHFWAAALDGYMTDHSGVRLKSDAGPAINFQRVPEAKSVKARVHLDIVTKDVEGDIFRLKRMGAKIVGEKEEDGRTWTVMQDVEGNEFCVIHGAD